MNLLLTGLGLIILIALVYWIAHYPVHIPPDPSQPFDIHVNYWLAAADIEGIDSNDPSERILRWADRIPDRAVRDQVLLRLLKNRRGYT